MCDPRDPRYMPQLEIVPVEPTVTERDIEDEFWEKNADVPVHEILKEGTKPKPHLN